MIDKLSIAELYALRVQVNNQIEAIEKEAFEQLNQGNEVPNYSLKKGRKSRKWKDEDAVSELLCNNGFSNDAIYDVKMKGIPAIEKAIKGTEIELDDFIQVTEGSPSLVYTGES